MILYAGIGESLGGNYPEKSVIAGKITVFRWFPHCGPAMG
jgi:hypothetical protein